MPPKRKRAATEDKKTATMPKKSKGKRTSGIHGKTTKKTKGIGEQGMSSYLIIGVDSNTNWPTAIDRDYDAWYNYVATMNFDTPRVYITEDKFNQILGKAVGDDDDNEERQK